MKKFIFQILNDRKGVAAIIVIVIIGAAALLMAYGASWAGIADLDIGYSAQKGEEAAAFADGCMDDTLQKLRFDINYTGASLNFSGGSCIINVTGAGSGRTIIVDATKGSYSQSLKAVVSLNGNIISLNSLEQF